MNHFITNSGFQSLEIAAVQTTQNKILGFAEYVAGWHFGEGVPPTWNAIERALRIETFLRSLGFGETDAFLGVSGARSWSR